MSGVLSVYALCVVVLCVKMFALSCYQGFYRIKSLVFTNREDAGYFNRPVSPQELPQVARAAKAWANDLENIPLFFVLGGLCCALETSSGVTIWLFCMFSVARGVALRVLSGRVAALANRGVCHRHCLSVGAGRNGRA